MSRHELIIAFAIALATRHHTSYDQTNEAAVLAADHLLKLLEQEDGTDVC